jgi:hypothetical protein
MGVTAFSPKLTSTFSGIDSVSSSSSCENSASEMFGNRLPKLLPEVLRIIENTTKSIIISAAINIGTKHPAFKGRGS